MFLSQLSTSSVSVKSCISSSGSSKPRKLTKHKHLHFKKQFKDKSVMSDFISRIVLTWQVETVTHLLTVTERVSLRSISSTSSRAAFASQLTPQSSAHLSGASSFCAWHGMSAVHVAPFTWDLLTNRNCGSPILTRPLKQVTVIQVHWSLAIENFPKPIIFPVIMVIWIKKEAAEIKEVSYFIVLNKNCIKSPPGFYSQTNLVLKIT